MKVELGKFIIDLDINKTKEIYNKEYISKCDCQICRNYKQFIEYLSEEEKSFFNALGINPLILPECPNYSEEKSKNITVNGVYYIAAKFIYYPYAESIVDEGFDDSDNSGEDTGYNLGRYNFHFINNFEHKGTSYGFVGIDTILEMSFTVTVPWLLKEKKHFNHVHGVTKYNYRRYLKKSEKQTRNYILELLQKSNINFKQYNSREYKKFYIDWFNHFGIKDKECIELCLPTRHTQNHLWHLFSWEFLECISGIDANDAYTKQIKKDCIILFEREKLCFEIHNVLPLDNDIIKKFTDLYITDKDFTWTYVQTHEGNCGPYFYKL